MEGPALHEDKPRRARSSSRSRQCLGNSANPNPRGPCRRSRFAHRDSCRNKGNRGAKQNVSIFSTRFEILLQTAPWRTLSEDSGPCFAINVSDEPSDCTGVAEYPQISRCRVGSDCLHENRAASRAVRHQPTPEVGTLARSSDRSPGTADKREVQKDDCVRRSKPNLDNVVGAQVAIHDPSIFRHKLLLHNRPPIARCCEKTRTPENFVKLDDWDPRHPA